MNKDVAERSIYRVAAAKQIPALNAGGSWQFSRSDIDIWLKQQSMEAIKSTKKDSGEPT